MRAWQATLLCISALSFFAARAYAGAWTQAPGQGLLILTASDYNTSSYFDNSGHRTHEAHYRQYALSPYLEYGLADGLTVGGNFSGQYASQATKWHAAMDDTELFIRKRIWEGDGFAFSAEPMVKIPSPASPQRTPLIGSVHPDAGLSINSGYGFQTNGLNHFIELDTQYRERFGPPKNQLRLNASAGFSITPQWMILPQAFFTRRMGSVHNAAFTQSSGDDYNDNKYQLSAVYRMDGGWSLQGGAFVSASGKNTGAGHGLLFAVWKAF